MECRMTRRIRAVPQARFVTAPHLKSAGGGLAAVIALFTIGDASPQSASTVISVTARIVAPCTVSTTNPQSTCSHQTLSQQSDITQSSAQITSTDNEATVTHKGGLPPTIEKLRDRILLSF